MLEVHPVAPVHQLSSPVTKVPQGVQKARIERRVGFDTGLCQIVSVSPVSRSWRCTPDWSLSNTVNR